MAISFKVNGGPAGQIMSAADLHGGFGSPCGLRSDLLRSTNKRHNYLVGAGVRESMTGVCAINRFTLSFNIPCPCRFMLLLLPVRPGYGALSGSLPLPVRAFHLPNGLR